MGGGSAIIPQRDRQELGISTIQWRSEGLLRSYVYLVMDIRKRCDYANHIPEDFALIEASYVVVRLLQRFPNIEMPSDEVHEKIGKEKQLTTLVMAIGGTGCQIQFD